MRMSWVILQRRLPRRSALEAERGAVKVLGFFIRS